MISIVRATVAFWWHVVSNRRFCHVCDRAVRRWEARQSHDHRPSAAELRELQRLLERHHATTVSPGDR